MLAERLQDVDIYGGKCAGKNAEARAFLAKLRGSWRRSIDRGEIL